MTGLDEDEDGIWHLKRLSFDDLASSGERRMSATLNADKQETDDLGAVEVANHLLERVGVSRKIRSIKECNDEYFLALYLAITGESPPGFISSPHGNRDRIRNCQAVIDSLANEVLEIDLSHIEGKDIVDGNIAAIANLLEIFMGLLEYIYEELEREDNQCNKEYGEADKEDSNLLPDDHDILSDVIEEEFGGSLTGRGKRNLHGARKEPDVTERCLVPKEPPTRDSDMENVSLHDFTQDSLINRNAIEQRQRVPTQAQPSIEMHPFAYFSASSSSNSTENLAKEAEIYDSYHFKSGRRDVRSASTSKLKEKLPEQGSQQGEDHLRKTDPTLCTTLSRERHRKVDSLASSMSSPKWPSTLSAKDLNTSKGSKPTGYEEVGARPRGPLPGEVEKVSDTSSESSSSVIHKHTHHHYHHHHPASKSDDDKRKAKVTSVVDASTSKDPQGGDGLAEQTRQTIKSQYSRVKDAPNKNDIMRSDHPRILEGSVQPPDRTEAIRVRSVQTSVSDMPGATVSSHENRTESQPNKTGPPGHERSRSDQSSITKFNESLNLKKKEEMTILEKEAKAKKRSDVLKDLDQKLEEVRAAVKAIEGAQLLSTELTEKNANGLRHFLEEGETIFLSSPNEEKTSDLREESICSDSEFDYGLRRESLRRKTEVAKPRDRDRKELIQQGLSKLQNAVGEKRDQFERRKKVHFKDHLRESRDDRLERLIRSLKKEDRENESRIENVRKQYSRDLKATQQKQKHKVKIGNAEEKQAKAPLQNTANRSASKLARIYGQRSRKPEREVNKQRKRSASCSPVPRARRRGRLVVEEDDILPVMEDEFPHLYLSPVTAKMMWQKQMRQISNLTKAAHLRKPTKVQKQIEEASRKQERLMTIMKKELEHNKRLKEAKLKLHEQRQVKSKLRERRLASARARRYYDEYQVRMRARMLKRRTKEEKIFKTLFEDALQIQKQRVRELRTYAKEQREMDAQRKQNELESIENFYRDQFSMMAETVSRERHDLQIREKAQRKVVDDMRKGIRQRMENDIKDLQEELVRDEDSAYFRQLDADNLRKELQLATYKVRI